MVLEKFVVGDPDVQFDKSSAKFCSHQKSEIEKSRIHHIDLRTQRIITVISLGNW